MARAKKSPAPPAPEAADSPDIILRGARTHNLKSVSCTFPAGGMTVVTGPSGSGKSSLAFDTLFAEGQRRYVESLSAYARQFVARMPRPDVDEIENIPPAIALEQKNHVRNARSTIGSATEINDYLRLIFAKAGRLTCPKSGLPVRRDSPDSIARRLLESMPGGRATFVAPIALQKKSMLKDTLAELQRQGFTRLLIDGDIAEIDQPGFKAPALSEIPVVVDRLAIDREERPRLVEAIEQAYRLANGRCIVHPRGGDPLDFSEELRCEKCADCGIAFREPSVQLLNFGNPLGACPACEGFGRIAGIDWGKVIPNPALTINQEAIACFAGDMSAECLRDLKREAARLDVRIHCPWEKLTDRERDIVMFGEKPRGKWYGIKGYFDYLEERRYKVQSRILLARYRGYVPCTACNGTRLRPEALAIRVGGRHLGDVCDLSVRDLAAWLDTLQFNADEARIAERPLAEAKARLRYLLEVGLGYLTLSRQTRTLSGGESQRINLATALGSALTETLYVLDEPTVGLHPRDTARLIGILHRLRDLGNTVVVVEHDPEVMRASDRLLDIGPRAGEGGGQVIFQGRVSEIAAVPDSLTAKYLAGSGKAPAGKKARATEPFGRRSPRGWITIHGARQHNLRAVTARLPLGVLCCVSGVSGSGKSTLIHNCLYHNYLRQALQDPEADPGDILRLEGLEQVDGIVMVDQAPLQRSTRSNPATYLKAYDRIRELLVATSSAQALDLEVRDFSFNVEGGRCEKCEGTGRQVIDMQFLADVEVVCEVCEGRRFTDKVLQATLNGLNVTQILDLTVDQAIEFFAEHRRVLNGLEPLQRVGLGYLRLGQSTATLSGGEAQRLKLAQHIAEATERKNLLLLFDEPTTGLHPSDLDVLIRVFDRLIDEGFSLVVIEHNLQLLRRADWILDMGPDSGDAGGEIVVEGPPETIAAHPRSITGKYLAEEMRR